MPSERLPQAEGRRYETSTNGGSLRESHECVPHDPKLLGDHGVLPSLTRPLVGAGG